MTYINFNLLILKILLFACFGKIHSVESSKSSGSEKLNIGFFIISQVNRHHNVLAEIKKNDILSQAKKFSNQIEVHVYKTHEDFHYIGHWTILPLFEKLSKLSELSWFFFLEEATNIHLEKLLDVFLSYNQTQDVFAGYALADDDPTIIHHFANSILYPHFSAGFFLNLSLLKKLALKCKDCAFSIDPKFELAKFIWENAKIKLKNETRLCLKKNFNCATWIDGVLPSCGTAVSASMIFVAVKTCEKYHTDRVKFVKQTWAASVKKLYFFSDVSDDEIPSVKLPVKNVLTGHCEKTLSILKYYVNNNIQANWVVIVDDDTLLSFQRLKNFLSCYVHEEFVALGERYGYGIVNGHGYNYLTGGSGMIFSVSTAKQLARSCKCPSIDSPDDMIIGLCLKNLNIPVTHSAFFHQARPGDYSSDFLKPFKHISFHKHWMINPYEVYRNYLFEIDYSDHSEL